MAALGEQQERMEALLEEAKVTELDIKIQYFDGETLHISMGETIENKPSTGALVGAPP